MLRDGVARLTLDAAAAEAGLSKGGVLYHFPTRDALVAGMVAKIIEEFDRDIERRLEEDGGARLLHPGVHRGHHGAERRPTRPRGPAGGRVDRGGGGPARSAGAAPGRRPTAGRPAWRTDGLDPTLATVLRLACDGLWMCDLFGLAPPDGDRRSSVGRALDQLAREPS